MSIRLKDTITGNLSGNSSTATTLATARTINGTSFNGSANITTANWGTARTLTIGNSGKSVNGSANVSWSLSEIGAAAASHTHNYAGSNSAGGPANKVYLPRLTGSSNTPNYLPGTSIFEIKEFGNDCSNMPTAAWYHIFTGQGTDSNYNTQLALGMTNQAVFYRYRNAGTWGSWKQLAFTDSSITGNAGTATTLQTARTINGTSFNGSANITTANWGTARTLTIGNTGKSVNGSGNVSWSLAEIGAAAASHTHSYLPLSGGTLTGNVTISTDSKLEWNRNTDYARISFKNTGDDDSDSYMHFLTGDNGNEYFKFSSLSGSTTTDLLTIKTDHLRYKGNTVYHAGNKPTLADIGAASTAVATTSANGLMSKADKSKLDSIATNAQFKMTVTSSSWTADGSLYSTTINHNLNKEVLYVSAYDSSSKKSIFVSYTIINNNSLKVTVESAINAVITIVVEGGLINLAAGGISDSTTAANTTWSSTKIQSTINATVKDGTTSQKGIVQLSSATNSTSTTLAATASAVKAAYDLANTANNTANTIKNSTNNNRTITMSTANPSGGKNGDIWFKYE